MKMYYVELECVEPLIISDIPEEYESIRIILVEKRNVNGNPVYVLNHENKELLIKYTEYLGFQYVEATETEFDDQYVEELPNGGSILHL